MACCKLNASLNTGKKNQTFFGVGQRMYIQRRIADDGTKNGLPSSFTGTQVEWDALTQDADTSKRLYPVGLLKDIENVLGDDITASFSDGSTQITADGIRTVSLFIPNVDNVFTGKLGNQDCFDVMVYFSDKCGNYRGYKVDGVDLFTGVAIQQGTFRSKWQEASNTAPAGSNVSFEFSTLALDSNLSQFNADELVVSPNEIEGLNDFNVEVTALIATGFLGIATQDSALCNELPFTGAVLGSWILTNKTTNLVVAVSGATEAPTGSYTFAFIAQTAGDKMELTFDTTTGFDTLTKFDAV